MVELEPGILRLTLPLPLGIDHVHCYLLRSSNGGWIAVDTGLGTEEVVAAWRSALAGLDAPVEAVVITHFHPDHIGAARDVAELTGAAVLQGRADHAQCVRVFGSPRVPSLASWWADHGVPAEYVEDLVAQDRRLTATVHWVESPDRLLEPGDDVDGWRIELLPGHADGHIVLHRDGVLIAGDVILEEITPAVGLYPNSHPDPLGDYLGTLARIEELAPRVAYAGHKQAIADPAARARAIRAHHDERLEQAEHALDGAPRSAYDVSLALFARDLPIPLRRFATAESLAHLERLVLEGRAARVGSGYVRVP